MDRTPAQLSLLYRVGMKTYKREIVQLAQIVAVGSGAGFSGDQSALKRLTNRLEATGEGVAGGFHAKIRGLVFQGRVKSTGGPSGRDR